MNDAAPADTWLGRWEQYHEGPALSRPRALASVLHLHGLDARTAAAMTSACGVYESELIRHKIDPEPCAQTVRKVLLHIALSREA